MTQRSEMAHRIAELKARLMTALANRAFTHRTRGLDGLAKRVLARAAERPVAPRRAQNDAR